MKGYVGDILNTGVLFTLAIVFSVIIGLALFKANVIFQAVGITGFVTAGILYLTSKQKWVEY